MKRENFETSADNEEEEEEELRDDGEDSLSSVKGRSTNEIIAGVMGTIMDTYDFSMFGYFSDVIAKVFFAPEKHRNDALIQSFCIFGSAFLVRPIGSVIFGKIGDTYGRKIALMWSILLMAGATFTIGCLPTYNTIGRPASILLFLVRLLQGVSLGGQFTTSVVFTMEGKPKNTWALRGAIASTAGGVGMLLGCFVGYSIRETLSQKELEAWGWRIPFLTGLLLGLPGMYLKYHNDDSSIDRKIRAECEDSTKSPVEILLSQKHRRVFISALFVSMISGTCLYLINVWVPIFMKTLIRNPIDQAYLINFVVITISVSMNPFVGFISDKYFKRTQVMYVGGVCLAIFSPSMIVIIGQGKPLPAFLAQVTMSIFFVLWNIPMYAWLAQSFPIHVRLSGVSISYNVAFAIGGGFTPALATLLLDKFGPASPGLLVSGVACVSMIALLTAPPIMDHRSNRSTEESSMGFPLKADYDRRELVSYRQVVV